MDFSGPITNNNRDTYILMTIHRYSRYPHAEAYNNCDTETALSYLKEDIFFHGKPRSVRLQICKDNNIKLILAPTGDHRGTAVVERLI